MRCAVGLSLFLAGLGSTARHSIWEARMTSRPFPAARVQNTRERVYGTEPSPERPTFLTMAGHGREGVAAEVAAP
jgi:hypothetical protein